MSDIDISRLDRKTIVVCLELNGRHVRLKGIGALYVDPLLGDCLRIQIQDPTFELILREREFAGEIQSGAELGCDFYIPLSCTCQSKAS